MKLTGTVALITNVSHFMGPAITEEFCREGASVALHDREPGATKPFAAIAERLGRDVLVLGGDLGRYAQADRAGEAVGAVVWRCDRRRLLPGGCGARSPRTRRTAAPP